MKEDQFPKKCSGEELRICDEQVAALSPGDVVEVMEWSKREKPWVGRRFRVARHDPISGLVMCKTNDACVAFHWEALRKV